jgi:hypothetical protein
MRFLALTLVGLPIFLFHWLWAQRLAAADDEERTASLRAIFFYGLLLGTLILLQNLFALVMRTLLMAMRLEPGRALFGPTQTASDNLIAIVINGLVALYFWQTLKGELAADLEGNANFSDVRRLYRYLWVIYGLLMTIFGAQQILRFIFFVPAGLLSSAAKPLSTARPCSSSERLFDICGLAVQRLARWRERINLRLGILASWRSAE